MGKEVRGGATNFPTVNGVTRNSDRAGVEQRPCSTHPQSIQGWEPLTMKYGQTASSKQMTFLGEEHTTKPKPASVPVYKIMLVREGRVPCYNQQIRSSADASTLLLTYLADVDREHFVIILLNQKNRVIGVSTISIGSLTASIVHPREVFKGAILSNAASIICGHNHPST